MKNKEAYALIGERANELSKKPEVQNEMIKIAKMQGKEDAERYLYILAITTLCGL